MIPMPPSHCVRLRQNRRDFGRASISVRIVEPVVVNPEAVSKKASMNPGIYPEMKYGRQPTKDAMNHAEETMKKLNLGRR